MLDTETKAAYDIFIEEWCSGDEQRMQGVSKIFCTTKNLDEDDYISAELARRGCWWFPHFFENGFSAQDVFVKNYDPKTMKVVRK